MLSYSPSRYVAVQGDWTQPSVYDCDCGTTDTDESTWSGLGGAVNIGGSGNNGLLQEGTSMQGTGQMFAWFEFIAPQGGVQEQQISNLPIAPGMPVHTYTAYQTSNSQANFLVCANGLCASIVGTIDSMFYDGSTAEQIDERPSYCSTGCYKPLTNFNQDNWTNMMAETVDGTWVNELQDTRGTSLWMANNNGDYLAAPTSFNATGPPMSDTWIRAS